MLYRGKMQVKIFCHEIHDLCPLIDPDVIGFHVRKYG